MAEAATDRVSTDRVSTDRVSTDRVSTDRVSIVIPAFDEEENLPRTVDELRAVLGAEGIDYELVLVDDNSRDATGEVIAELARSDARVRSISRTPPGGFGRAIRDGLEAARGGVVVIAMADSSDDPRDVVAYVRKIQEGYDCVFGSRFLRGSTLRQYPRGKLIANRIVNKAIQWLFRCPYNDLTNAFKAYRAEVIAACQPLQACHFNITIEMSLAALNRRFAIAQIPIAWYGRTWGVSNLKLREMGRRYLHTLIKAYGERVLISDDVLGESLVRRRSPAAGDSLTARVEGLEDRLQALEEARGDRVPARGATGAQRDP